MSYYVTNTNTEIRIPAEKIPAMMDAVNKEFCTSFTDVRKMLGHFGYSDYDAEPDGSLTYFSREYDKWNADSEGFLYTIGPYVDEGSYLDFVGEDGSAWRFYFNGKCAAEYNGHMVYTGCPKED